MQLRTGDFASGSEKVSWRYGRPAWSIIGAAGVAEGRSVFCIRAIAMTDFIYKNRKRYGVPTARYFRLSCGVASIYDDVLAVNAARNWPEHCTCDFSGVPMRPTGFVPPFFTSVPPSPNARSNISVLIVPERHR